MRCPKCGNENPNQARFCRSCGERLVAEGEGAFTPRILTPEERSRRLLEDGFRLAEEGRLQSAIQACQQAIAMNPTSTSAHSLLGTLYERVGDRDGAIREYEQVLTLSPGSTVERRRLNELMGVAAAAEPAVITPRTARMAITGGFVVVALVLVAAIIFTSQRPQPAVQQALRRPGQLQQVAQGPSLETFPSRLSTLGRVRPPRYARGQARQQVARAPQPQGQGYGQYLGPGTWALPGTGGQAYGGLASGRGGGAYSTPPVEGAVPSRGAPTVTTPGWVYPTRYAAGAATPAPARQYYFEGDYRRAIESYRGYLSQNPQAAEPREELAWVYTEAGDYGSATQEYRAALNQYRQQLERGHNVEAARHGVRTCESAIRALETR
ncbi:MAG: tetratricopeptide repeat protein [Armatimonadota bacterium]